MASDNITEDDHNLETLLARATNPLHRQPDAVSLSQFCDFVEKEHDGPQTALRLLAHKIQSPLEKESLLALSVLEEAVKKCGAKFRSEFGKFRFLNEMIKVVSPKYLGNRASPKVKQKIIELMFLWSIDLKQETKIFEAYQMLKRQGVVVEDPVYVKKDYQPMQCPPPRPKSAIFDDEENAQLLQRLLHSNRPEDLQAANKLIKNMVKEADRRMELLAKRSTELETVHNNAKVLADMLDHYSEKDTSAEELELMKELYESCARLRPKLFRLAGEMDEKDEGLGDILKANEELTIVISHYKKTMHIPEEKSTDQYSCADSSTKVTKNGASLLDLGSPVQEPLPSVSDSSLLDDQLLALGLNDPPDSGTSSALSELSAKRSSDPMTDLDQIFRIGDSARVPHLNPAAGSIAIGGLSSSLPLHISSVIDSNIDNGVPVPTSFCDVSLKPLATNASLNHPVKNQVTNSVSKGMEELDELGQSLLKQSLPSGAPAVKKEFLSTPQKVPLNQLKQQKEQEQKICATSSNCSKTGSVVVSSDTGFSTPERSSTPQNILQEALSLADVFVPLETVQPGSLPPLTLLEKNGLTVVIHFAQNIPRPDVSVMVVSTMSKNTSPVEKVIFQAAVPKSMKIKLQPPSATDLPPYNPILPPTAITQVLLLANPQKEKVRFRYKVNYHLNKQDYSETGEVDSLFSTR